MKSLSAFTRHYAIPDFSIVEIKRRIFLATLLHVMKVNDNFEGLFTPTQMFP